MDLAGFPRRDSGIDTLECYIEGYSRHFSFLPLRWGKLIEQRARRIRILTVKYFAKQLLLCIFVFGLPFDIQKQFRRDAALLEVDIYEQPRFIAPVQSVVNDHWHAYSGLSNLETINAVLPV